MAAIMFHIFVYAYHVRAEGAAEVVVALEERSGRMDFRTIAWVAGIIVGLCSFVYIYVGIAIVNATHLTTTWASTGGGKVATYTLSAPEPHPSC